MLLVGNFLLNCGGVNSKMLIDKAAVLKCIKELSGPTHDRFPINYLTSGLTKSEELELNIVLGEYSRRGFVKIHDVDSVLRITGKGHIMAVRLDIIMDQKRKAEMIESETVEAEVPVEIIDEEEEEKPVIPESKKKQPIKKKEPVTTGVKEKVTERKRLSIAEKREIDRKARIVELEKIISPEIRNDISKIIKIVREVEWFQREAERKNVNKVTIDRALSKKLGFAARMDLVNLMKLVVAKEFPDLYVLDVNDGKSHSLRYNRLS
jgi:hypothetical protein